VSDSIWLLVILGAINHQVTHIITIGVIFEDVRAFIQQRIGGKMGYLVTCHLCAGSWVGFMMAFAAMDHIKLDDSWYVNWVLLSFAIALLGRLWNELLALASSKVSEIRSRGVPCGCD
jgi:hypothetical protein